MRDFWLIVAGVAWSAFLVFPGWGERSAFAVEADEDAAAAAAPYAVEGDVGGWVVSGGAKFCCWDEDPYAAFGSAPHSLPTLLGIVPAPLLPRGPRVVSRVLHALSITNYGRGW